MDNFNKVISFILGLVVVIVFFGVVTGRINLKNKIPLISSKQTGRITPTPSLSPTPISTVKISNNSSTNNLYQTKKVNSIPATGSPTEILLIIPALSTLGFWLKSTKSRDF
ncbi:MAG: hypothetical protein ACPL1D_00250 [Microgenomates group bacterium]